MLHRRGLLSCASLLTYPPNLNMWMRTISFVFPFYGIRNSSNRYTVGTVVQIAPKANTRLSGLYTSGGMFCTQCEAEGFRRITFAQDRPDVMSTFSVRTEAGATMRISRFRLAVL